MNRAKNIASLLCIFLLSFTLIQEKSTQSLTSTLFKIDRSKDANVVYYTLTTDSLGNINEEDPIKIYWIKNTKKGKVEPLTWIQKKYAYGIKYQTIADNKASFKFVSYDKMTFTLKKLNDKYKVYTLFDDKLVEVNNVFVQIDGGTFWLPNVSSVTIYATEVKTNQATTKVIHP